MKLDKSYKVKVNPEQSREIQELLNRNPTHTEFCYMRISVDDFFKYGFTSNDSVFAQWDEQEITAPELIALLSQPENKETKMTNLADFMKCEKVRCVDDTTEDTSIEIRITKGKTYLVIGTSEEHLNILDDDGEESYYFKYRFEPVLETQVTDSLDDTPISTRTKFMVGDKVYEHGNRRIYTVYEIHSDRSITISWGENEWQRDYVDSKKLCHATPENHELLCKLYPHIEFEKPPVLLQGSDLCRAMLDEGWKYVPCYVSNYGEDKRCAMDIVTARNFNGQFIANGGNFNHAVPFDPRTGEILTSEVLDD